MSHMINLTLTPTQGKHLLETLKVTADNQAGQMVWAIKASDNVKADRASSDYTLTTSVISLLSDQMEGLETIKVRGENRSIDEFLGDGLVSDWQGRPMGGLDGDGGI